MGVIRETRGMRKKVEGGGRMFTFWEGEGAFSGRRMSGSGETKAFLSPLVVQFPRENGLGEGKKQWWG